MKNLRFLSLFALISLIATACGSDGSDAKVTPPTLNPRVKQIIEVSGKQFIDLNANGTLDPYEDWRLSASERADDLISQMTPEEKAGLMVHGSMSASDGTATGGIYTEDDPGTADKDESSQITQLDNHVRYGMNMLGKTVQIIATHANSVQEYCEGTRLGIPFVLSTNPIHYYGDTPQGFSEWVRPLGFGSTMDSALVENFAKIAAKEFRAVGLRLNLAPMADLATEPRWARINDTFSEDADLAAQMVAAYIRGYQGEALTRDSVACMVKHFPGAGPQEDGYDSHFYFGKDQVYPGDNFAGHLKSFEAAFEAGVASVMPYYSVLKAGSWTYESIIDGNLTEQVGIAYNEDVIKDLLRGKYEFGGLVCTDWLIMEAPDEPGMLRAAYGMEGTTVSERLQKAVRNGIDQFGGYTDPTPFVTAYNEGLLTDADLNGAAKKALVMIFQLGLFENPYVDAAEARYICNTLEHRTAAQDAQYKSVVLLKNENNAVPGDLGDPYGGGPGSSALFLNISEDDDFKWSNYCNDTPTRNYESSLKDTAALQAAVTGADFVFIKIPTPSKADSRLGFFAVMANYPLGSLEYGSDQNNYQYQDPMTVNGGAGDFMQIDDTYYVMTDGATGDGTLGENPTANPQFDNANQVYLDQITDVRAAITASGSSAKIVVIASMARPSCVHEFEDDVDAIIVDWGVSKKTLFDMIYDIVPFTGKLPVGLPASDTAVDAAAEDVAGDGTHATYKYGYGL